MNKLRHAFFSLLIAVWLGSIPATAQDQGPAPAETARPAASLIAFYRTYLSGVDGDRCPMHPSCSAYSLEAFQKHGVLMGWVMTCDRLMRCGRDEKHIALSVPINGQPRIYDPLSNNDFWWARDRNPTAPPKEQPPR